MKSELIKSWRPPCALLAGLVAAAALIEAGSPNDPARAFLTDAFALSRAEIGRLDAGQVVSRTLDTTNAREVATIGVVRIATTPEKYVERLADIATFKRTDDVLQIGTFSSPPQMGDVAGLSLDEGDLRRLQACRIDDCGVRLPLEAIAEVARAVDWKARDATERATGTIRQLLVEYVARYRDRGAAALMRYASRAPRLEVGTEFAALVDSDRVAWRHLEDLRRHVLDYPHDRLGATDIIYWSKERVHNRGVVSLTHVSIMRGAGEAPIRFAIASKQIYAMHYFDASLGLTLLVPDGSAPSPATYVVYVNRSRIDLFGNLFGGVARRIVSGKARSLVGAQLARLQRTLGS